MPTIECQCPHGSNSVCRQAKAHPPTLLSSFQVQFNVCVLSGVLASRLASARVPTAAECNLAQLFRIRGQEIN